MGDVPVSDEVSRIKEILKEQPLGMNIKEIAGAVGMSRNSVAKYLDVLTASGHLEVRQIGNAKLYYLSRRIPARNLLDFSHEIVVVLDRDMRIVKANDSFVSFIGSPRKSLIGCKLSGLAIPFLSHAEESELSGLWNGGPSWKKQIRVIKDAHEIFFNARFISTAFEKGEFGITVMLEDVTERKYAETGSTDRDRLLHTIFQISSVPKFFINREHKVVFWDRALEIMTGIKAEIMIGTNEHWRAFYSQEHPCLADLLVDGAIDQLDTLYHGKCKKTSPVDDAYECTDFFPILGHNGKWLHITATVIRDSQGNLTGAMETLEDVTNQKLRDFVVET
jgi:PAS domain S-box-containing protein